MKDFIKNQVKLVLPLALILVFYVYSLSIHQDLLGRAGSVSNLNFWDMALSLLSDPYLFIYFTLPIFLFICVYQVETNFDYGLIIRFKSYTAWIFYTLHELAGYIFTYFALMGLTLALVLVTGPYSLSLAWSPFSQASVINGWNLDILPSLVSTGLSPLLAGLIQLAYSLVFFLLLALMLTIIYLFSQRKVYLIGASIFIFIYAATSFQFLPEELSFLSLASYAKFYHGFMAFNSIFTPLILMGGLALALLLGQAFFRQSSILVDQLKSALPYLVYTVLVFLGLFSDLLEYDGMGQTVGDFIFLKFYGVGSSGYSLLSLLYYLIVFLGFVYFFQVYLTNFVSQQLTYYLIRYKSYRAWFHSLLIGLSLAILVFLLGLALLASLLGLVKGYQFSYQVKMDTVNLSALALVVHFILNGFLQLMNYGLLLLIVTWLVQDAIYGLLSLGIFMVLMLPNINIGQVFPMGLNSFGLLDQESLLGLTFRLVFYLVLEYGLVRLLFKQYNSGLVRLKRWVLSNYPMSARV